MTVRSAHVTVFLFGTISDVVDFYFRTIGDSTPAIFVLNRFQQLVFNDEVEQHFLSRKLAHDQVTYSLIRVRDGDLAFELHQRLVEGEADFATHLEKNASFPRWLALAVARNHIFWADGKLDYPSAELVLALHPTFRTMEEWVKEHAPLVKFA